MVVTSLKICVDPGNGVYCSWGTATGKFCHRPCTAEPKKVEMRDGDRIYTLCDHFVLKGPRGYQK